MFNIIFFGSFQTYSNHVLEALLSRPDLFKVTGVVTTPPRPAGRDQKLTPTPTHLLAEEKGLPVFPLETLENDPAKVLNLNLNLNLEIDYFVVAGYGKLLPENWLSFPKIAAINVHFSLLPAFPGAFPAEWAILTGNQYTGVSIIRMSSQFDKGQIIAQEKIEIASSDTRETLYQKLYNLGGIMSVRYLPEFASGKVKAIPQNLSLPHKYARKITREDGFVPLPLLKQVLKGNVIIDQPATPLYREVTEFSKEKDLKMSVFIDRMVRAFTPWPGVWTISSQNERVKIISAHLEHGSLKIDSVQKEGKLPVRDKDAVELLNSLQ